MYKPFIMTQNVSLHKVTNKPNKKRACKVIGTVYYLFKEVSRTTLGNFAAPATGFSKITILVDHQASN
jgi:hypothetical protein